MHKFTVAVSAFYGQSSRHERIDACMRELIARHGLVGVSVLSVGAGDATEERLFAEAGCALRLVDIDQHDSILPRLQRLPPAAGLSFWIGDAAELETGDLGAHDLAYFSSFTPDELRRGDLVQCNSKRRQAWSLADDPFHPVMMSYTRAIRPGGLLIVQSYFNGIDTDVNPNYLAACERQLSAYGLYLVEVHRFQHSHAVMHYAAVKGEPRDAPSDKLSQFHGRAVAEPTERIFAAPAGAAGAAFSPPRRLASRIVNCVRRILAR